MSSIDVAVMKVSKEMNIPYTQARPVVMAYWKELYASLARCENSTITAKKLGSFTTSLFKTNVFVRTVIKRIRRLDTEAVFKDPARKEEVRAGEIIKLRKAWKQRDKLIVHYKNIKQTQRERKGLS